MSLDEFDALAAKAKAAAHAIASRFDIEPGAPAGAHDVSNCGSPNCGLTDVANCGVTEVANCGVLDVANCGATEI